MVRHDTFSGKYPTVTKSFKVVSVTVEGTQLQVVIVFCGMTKGQSKKKIIGRFKSVDGLQVKQLQCIMAA